MLTLVFYRSNTGVVRSLCVCACARAIIIRIACRLHSNVFALHFVSGILKKNFQDHSFKVKWNSSVLYFQLTRGIAKNFELDKLYTYFHQGMLRVGCKFTGVTQLEKKKKNERKRLTWRGRRDAALPVRTDSINFRLWESRAGSGAGRGLVWRGVWFKGGRSLITKWSEQLHENRCTAAGSCIIFLPAHFLRVSCSASPSTCEGAVHTHARTRTMRASTHSASTAWSNTGLYPTTAFLRTLFLVVFQSISRTNTEFCLLKLI